LGDDVQWSLGNPEGIRASVYRKKPGEMGSRPWAETTETGALLAVHEVLRKKHGSELGNQTPRPYPIHRTKDRIRLRKGTMQRRILIAEERDVQTESAAWAGKWSKGQIGKVDKVSRKGGGDKKWTTD